MDAKNEKLRLRATFFNNLSVGLYLGGLLIPYLAVVQHLGVITERLSSGSLTFSELSGAVATLVAMAMAAFGGHRMRQRAIDTIEQIQEGA